MKPMNGKFLRCLAAMTLAGTTFAADVVETARPVPATRPEMKQFLEELKTRTIRIPLPELTEQDKAALGDRVDSYESRLRYHYLPADEPSVFGGGTRGTRTAQPASATTSSSPVEPPRRDFRVNADANMTLSYSFKTMLFWIVSRTNNCHYCLGHQEQKLSAAGLSEDQIAALDADWSMYSPAEQAAFAFARKVTYAPHELNDDDIKNLLQHYTQMQILEMTMSTAWNNSINRWKEGAGIPQSSSGQSFFQRGSETAAQPKNPNLPIESFLTPTSDRFTAVMSIVAPLERSNETGKATGKAIGARPPLEAREVVERMLAKCESRQSRILLLGESEARKALGELASDGTLPNWLLLMAHFPNDASSRIRAINSIDVQNGELTLLQKAQVSWIVARQDRAWYAVGVARQKLRALGQTDDQIFALDGDWQQFSAADQAMFRVARNLAAAPIALTDTDVVTALEQTSPRHVVQLVNFVTSRAYFDRVTEVAALPLDK